ncbi:MAG: TonB-dependent receptor, partial [Caulobacteraceae bacterium]|nr:TonB-dependent receptor [Caulobacteraceae bacterium]
MRVHLAHRPTLWCSVAALALLGVDAHAQSAAPAGNEPAAQIQEIVVTATRRQERLLDVPISISAYDEQALDRRGVRDVASLSAMTPGLTFQSTGVSNNITIRGVAADPLRGPPTTAIYIDDTPLLFNKGFGTTSAPTPEIFDVQRVEVLRGPQGTLFGGSAMGGAVRFITPEPSLTSFSGYGRAELADTVGGGLSYEAGIAEGGPIIQDKLGFRASGWYRRDGGYVNNYSAIPGGANEKNSNFSDSYAGRLAFAFAPTSTITITPSLYYQDVSTNNRSYINPQASNPSDQSYVATNLMLAPSRDKFLLPSLKVQADVGHKLSFTSITSYLDRTSYSTADYTAFVPALVGGPPPTSASQAQQLQLNSKQQNFSQEFRLATSDPSARLKWTAGVFYRRSSVVGAQQIYSPPFTDFVLQKYGTSVAAHYGTPLYQGVYSLYQAQNFVDKELAGFVDADFAITDKLSIDAGVRVTRLDQTFGYQGAGPLVGLANNRGTTSSSPLTPRLSLNYKPWRDQLLYVTIAKGYRSGGANTPLALQAQPACQAALAGYGDTTTYAPDSLWSYEAGSKSSFFGGRARIDASAFHIDWKNIQNNVSVAACAGNFLA